MVGSEQSGEALELEKAWGGVAVSSVEGEDGCSYQLEGSLN